MATTTNHRPVQLIFILITIPLVVFTTLLAFTALARQYGFHEVFPNLLHYGLQDVADKYPTPISPAAWAHCLWGAILIYQITWSLHGLISVFRKTAGVPVYASPVILSVAMLVMFDLTLTFNIAWFITYDREHLATSCLLILLCTVCAWSTYGISLHTLDVAVFRLDKSERHGEIWATRLLVQNGLASYAVWTVMVMAFNFTAALIDTQEQVDKDTVTVTGMTIMAGVQVIYFFIDATCMDRFSRWVITPYIVPIITLTACLFRQADWYREDVNFIFLAFLLAFSFIALCAKSACVACREMRPRPSEDSMSSRLRPTDEANYLLK